jgi:hypothetical protein
MADHLLDERLPRRVVHRAEDAEQHREDDHLPQPDVPGQHGRAEGGRDQAEACLRAQQNAPFGVAVDQQPCIRRQQQDRRVPGRGGQPQDGFPNASAAARAGPARPSPPRCRSGSATARTHSGGSSAPPGRRTLPGAPGPPRARGGHVCIASSCGLACPMPGDRLSSRGLGDSGGETAVRSVKRSVVLRPMVLYRLRAGLHPASRPAW